MARVSSFVRMLLFAIGILGSTMSFVMAQEFPTRPIKIIVGYPPGGTTDIIARLIAARLAVAMGQAVVVENRPGAGGNIGAEYVAKSSPDGYTLQMGTAGNMTVNPSIYKNMAFDTVRDFQPISLIATVPNLMVINPKVPAKNVQEFVSWAKSQPGKVFFASSGTGNTPHMTAELFNIAAGIKMIHVPYKGSGPALTDLMGGAGVHVMFDNMPSAIGHARSGALRPIAVTSANRVASDPGIPTVKESGFPDFEVVAWFGLFAPAKTPRGVIDRLHREVVEAVKLPEISKKLSELGAEPSTNLPSEFATLVKVDRDRWAKVVKEANIQGF